MMSKVVALLFPIKWRQCMKNKGKQRNKKEWWLHAIVLSLILLFGVGLISLNQHVEKIALLPQDGSSFAKAEVIEILQDNVQENSIRNGTQILSVEIKDGAYKGSVVKATNITSYLYGASECETGSKVIVQLSEGKDAISASVYNYDRGNVIYLFIGLFLLVLFVIGGKKGLGAIASLIFTFISILFLYLPMIYLGFSPFFCAVLVVALTTMVTMYLIGGFSYKTLCSILGTLAGVIIAGIIANLFGYFGHINGYNVEDIETLVYIGQNSKIQIGGLLFSGVLISALGAVMDVAMSVSTTIEEIYHHNSALTRKELFQSGIKVGSDMMSTMSNTLILAFTGGSISILIIDYAYHMPYLQILNSYTIGIEIMQGIAGTLGVVLTVPFVSLICCIFMTKKKKTLIN